MANGCTLKRDARVTGRVETASVLRRMWLFQDIRAIAVVEEKSSTEPES